MHPTVQERNHPGFTVRGKRSLLHCTIVTSTAYSPGRSLPRGAGGRTLKYKATPFAPVPQILLYERGCNARTHNLGSLCCRPVLTHIPLGMRSAPAQLAAGCQFWILLPNHLGVVVALGPKQPIVCSHRGVNSWGSHAVPADVSISCFLLCECIDV